MKKFVLSVALALLVLSGGCIPSLHPVYTEEDLVFEPDLIGKWQESGSKDTWHFTEGKKKTYRLVYTNEKGKNGTFDVHLARIDGTLFLDLFPEPLEVAGNDFYKAHFRPVHSFILVREISPTLRMSMMDPEWLENHLAEHPDALRHEKIDDQILITAPTKQLQAFLLKHTKTEDAFGEGSNMKKLPEEAPPVKPTEEPKTAP